MTTSEKTQNRISLVVLLLLVFLAGAVAGHGPIWNRLTGNPDRARIMASLHHPLPKPGRQFGAPKEIYEAKNRLEIYKYIQEQQKSLDDMWRGYFGRVGLDEPEVWLNIVHEGSYESNCLSTVVVPNGGAFYCNADNTKGRDGTIWMPLDSELDNETFTMYTLLHENGHHIQHELQEQLDLPDLKDPIGNNYIETELIAECFTGVMARAYKNGGLLTQAQEEAMLYRAQFTSDYAHGTNDQRVSAYRLGFDTSMPVSCIDRFWVTWESF